MSVKEIEEDLEKAPEQSLVVLSASGHFPTGADLSQEEWKRVTDILAVCFPRGVHEGLGGSFINVY